MENLKLESFMQEFIDNNNDLSDDDREFIKYSKLFKERFGREPYIPEPSGTIEDTIKAIKICLEKNEDILDELLYPNLKEDLDKGKIY